MRREFDGPEDLRIALLHALCSPIKNKDLFGSKQFLRRPFRLVQGDDLFLGHRYRIDLATKINQLGPAIVHTDGTGRQFIPWSWESVVSCIINHHTPDAKSPRSLGRGFFQYIRNNKKRAGFGKFRQAGKMPTTYQKDHFSKGFISLHVTFPAWPAEKHLQKLHSFLMTFFSFRQHQQSATKHQSTSQKLQPGERLLVE